MPNSRLLSGLWRSHTSDAVKAAFKNIKYKTVPVGNRRNNTQPCGLAGSPLVAINEGVTNGLDAVIMQKVRNGSFNPFPTTVGEATYQIGRTIVNGQNVQRPEVFVLHSSKQNGNKNRYATITIIDCGIGMDESGMINGILNVGSSGKTLDPIQHGQFGAGGSTLYGSSDASLVISRTDEQDYYTFTAVWLESNATDAAGNLLIPSYVYATDAAGNLFRASAENVKSMIPHSNASHKHHMNDGIILPIHGTVRRCVGMEVNYKPGLWNFFQDQFFGSNATVKTFSDQSEKQVLNQVGRRLKLNSLPVATELPITPLFEKKLLAHVPPSVVTVTDKSGRAFSVKMEAWVVNSYLRKEKTESDEINDPLAKIKVDNSKKAKLLLPLVDWIEPVKGKMVPHGIFVTQNGQCQGNMRLRSAVICRNANLTDLPYNLIVEVRLDDIPLALRHFVFTGDRCRLVDGFQDALELEVISFLKDHPTLKVVNDHFRKQSVVPANDLMFTQSINDYLQSPLMADIFSFSSKGGDNADVDDNKLRPTGKSKHKERDIPILSAYPTFVEVLSRTFVEGKTGWLTISTDADNSHVVNFSLPPFVQKASVDDVGLLDNGTFRIQLRCTGNVGNIGEIHANITRNDKTVIRAEPQNVEVIEAKKRAAKTGNKGGSNPSQSKSHGTPKVEVRQIYGIDDENYANTFIGIDDSEGSKQGTFNFTFDRTNNTLRLSVNERFPMAVATFEQITKTHGRTISSYFHEKYMNWMIGAALFTTENQYIGDFGITTPELHRTIADNVSSFLLFLASLANDPDYVRNIKDRRSNADDADPYAEVA